MPLPRFGLGGGLIRLPNRHANGPRASVPPIKLVRPAHAEYHLLPECSEWTLLSDLNLQRVRVSR
jgi:hypothetical protein